MANAMGDTAKSDCNKEDGTETSVEIGAGIRDNMDGPEETESKVDIIILDKTNKTAILVNYLFNI